MATDTTVFTRPTPSKLVTVVPNALISLLLRSPLHGLVSKSCVLLSFRGRKTEHIYTFPVGYFSYEGDTVEIIPLHNWWKNLCGNVPVILWLKGRKYQAIADASHGDEMTAKEVQRLIQVSPTLIRVCRVECDAAGQPKTESVRRVAQSLVLVRVRLAPSI